MNEFHEDIIDADGNVPPVNSSENVTTQGYCVGVCVIVGVLVGVSVGVILGVKVFVGV